MVGEVEHMTSGSGRSQHPISFGVVTAQHQYTWHDLVDRWQLAEELGFDSIWLFDHFMPLYGDPGGPCLETSTLLSALALKTTRARIGVLVYGNTHRNPCILAKEIVTVDHVSNGRAILGIGAGWNEREHKAFGIPFPSPGERVEMLDEALQVMEQLFTHERTTFRGAHYQLDDAPFAPKPVQGHLPVLVGGDRPKMLKVIARHADLWDTSRPPNGIREGLEQIANHCREFGRDPAEIAVSSTFGADRLEDEKGFPALIRTYRAAGSSQFLFDFPLVGPGLETAKRVATSIIPELREELA
jgi:alkanesulfonate monooxygenase SsuD/methylene tetrahydromethanopterin reductase-like flavin-dependent oxidoreductase (luciferase family)